MNDKNPINISSGTIFLCGNFEQANPGTLQIFNEMEALISHQGQAVINGATIISKNENLNLRQKETLKFRMTYLAMCDALILLEDWEKDEQAKILVTAARLLGKSVEYFRVSKFYKKGL